MDTREYEKIGRAVCEDGRLGRLRKRLNLTNAAMADMLGVAMRSYQRWETGQANLRVASAVKVGRFYKVTQDQLKILRADGVNLKDYMPFHEAAGWLGIPQENLFSLYRSGEFEAEEFGILGLWVKR